jgi:hypothetical protein
MPEPKAEPKVEPKAEPAVEATPEPPVIEVKATPPPAPPSNEITITTQAVEGGRVFMRVRSPARSNQPMTLSYGGSNTVHVLDGRGEQEITVDAFAGSSHPIQLRFKDGSTRDVAVEAGELDIVSKIAIIWQAPVNLDLHAFEYAARAGDPGHVWTGSAIPVIRAREIARAGQRARGVMTTTDGGDTLGDKIEVYTVYHSPNEVGGSIAFAIDFETRGDRAEGNYCGQAPFAAIPFTVVTLQRDGTPKRESGVLAAQPCGSALTREQRLETSLLPLLRTKP